MDFNQAKELMKLQQEAQKIQEELSNTHIEAEFDGVVVTIDGQLKVVKVEFENKDILRDESRLANAIKEAVNKGMKKAQEIAAEKMKGVMGKMGLDIPGMS
jgi:DNA-binding protein YbaB